SPKRSCARALGITTSPGQGEPAPLACQPGRPRAPRWQRLPPCLRSLGWEGRLQDERRGGTNAEAGQWRGRLAVAAIASEAIITRLAEWGVDTIFGIPGDGINGIMEGLRRHQDKVRFVLVHHEEAGAFMATGYAKATGRLGVCLATSGPGGIHLLNGLYDARLDHAPVLAITGMQETSVLGTGYQQEV